MPEGGRGFPHIHVGPGCLGLGLIVTAGVEADLDVHLIARAVSALPPDPMFKALEKGQTGMRSFDLPVSTFTKGETLDALGELARQLVVDAPEALITIAATTEGFEARHKFLLEIAAARAERAGSQTVFVPCENDPGRSYPEFRTAMEALGVDCRDTMVNRLCPKLKLDPVDGAYQVTVDEVAEWVIQGAPDHRGLQALESLAYVEFAPDLEPFETRKRWLVNGAHLALAILAHARNIPSIDIAAVEPGRARWLQRLHAALIEALEHEHPHMTSNEEYAARHVAAWTRHEDEVTRILRRLKREQPLPFFDDLERKLIEPVSLLSAPASIREVRYVLDRLHYLLVKAKSYVDFEKFRSFLPTLPTAVDVRMCSRYEEILAPVLGTDEASSRAESLGVALEGHREDLASF